MLKKLSRFKKIRKIHTEDFFIKRLKSTVIGEGMLNEGNIYLLDYAIKNMPKNGIVVEIGSHGGLSTNLILYLLKLHNRSEKLFNCDPWIYEGFNDKTGKKSEFIDGSKEILRTDYMNYIQQAFVNSVQLLNKDNLPHTFNITSDAFFELFEKGKTSKDIFNRDVSLDRKISFAYIDGDHSYEYAKKDFLNVDKHLLLNGYILLDDSIDGTSFGSAYLMKEIKKNKSYKVVYKNPNYLIQKVG